MAYWGYKTPGNFAVWLIVTVLLVTGAVWLIIGGIDTGGCNACYSEFNMDLSPKDSNTAKGCQVLQFAFVLHEPKLAAQQDARDQMWGWCMYGTGPVGELAAGATMFMLGLLLLVYFCLAKKPEAPIPVADKL
jgi:hypothetical protein